METSPEDPPLVEASPTLLAPPAPARDPFWGWSDFFLVIGLLVAMLFFILIVAALATFLRPNLKTDPTPLLLPTQLAFYAAIYLAFLLAFRFRHSQPVFASLGWRRTLSLRTLAFLGLGGAVLSPLVSGIATLLQTPEVRMDILDQLGKQPILMAAFGLLAVTIAPLFEELLFRGFLQPLFSRTFGVVGGILLTSLLFGSLHAFQYKFVWQYVAAVSVVGAVLGFARYRTGSIIPGTVMHACYNSVAVIALIFNHK